MADDQSTAPPTPNAPPAPPVSELGPDGHPVIPPTPIAGVDTPTSTAPAVRAATPTEDWAQEQIENHPVNRIWNAIKEGIPAFNSKFEAASHTDTGKLASGETPKMQLITPEAAITPKERKAHPIATGIAEEAGGLTSPGTFATIVGSGGFGELPGTVGKVVPKLVSLGFSAQSLKGAYDQLPELKKAWDSGDGSEVERILTHVVLDTAVGLAAGQHATEGARESVEGGGQPDAASTLKVPKTEAGQNEIPDHITFNKLGGIERRGPDSFGRTGGPFSHATNAAFDIIRKYNLQEPEEKIEVGASDKPAETNPKYTGPERRGPDTFGRGGGPFGQSVDASYETERQAKGTVETPQIQAEGPEWDRTHSAVVDGKKVGSVGYKLDTDGRAQIYGSNVSPELRGKGLGQKLYIAAIDDAQAAGASRITSDSTNTSPDANRVWEKLKAKGLPVENITHPNGKPGYQIDFDNPPEPAPLQEPPAKQFEQTLARRGQLPNQTVNLSSAYGDTGKYVGGHVEYRAGVDFPGNFEKDNFDSRRTTGNNMFDPEAFITGDEMQKGMTYANSHRDWESEDAYQDAVHSRGTSLQDVANKSPRVFNDPEIQGRAEWTRPVDPNTVTRERAQAQYIQNLGVTKGPGLMPIPADRLPANTDTHSVVTHELGHGIVANLVGLPTDRSEVISHLHPDSSPGAAGAITLDFSNFPGVTRGSRNGFYHFSQDALKEAWPKFLPTWMAGGVAQELVHGLPMETNKGMTGDLRVLHHIGENLMGFTKAEVDDMIKAGADQAKTLLNHPATLDIIKREAGVREEGLSKTLHVSNAKVQDVIRQVREARANESNTEGNRGANGEVVSKTEPSQAGGNTQGDVREDNGKAISATAESRKVKYSPESDWDDLAQNGGWISEKGTYHAKQGEESHENMSIPGSKENAVAVNPYGEALLFRVGSLNDKTKSLLYDAFPQVLGSPIELDVGKKNFSFDNEDDALNWLDNRAGRSISTTAESNKNEYHPDLQKVADKYGVSEDPAGMKGPGTKGQASFITPDGKFIHLPAGVEHPVDWKELGENTGAIRARFSKDRAGDTMHLSVPKQGVMEDQIPALRQAVSQAGRYGNVVMERSDVNAKNKDRLTMSKEFPKVSETEDYLRQIEAHPDQNKPWSEKAAAIAKTQGGGFTIDPRTGETPKTGYQIEVGTEQRPAPLDHDATAKDIQNFYDQNKELFDKYPELHVGGYKNELNLSAHVESLEDAKRVAKKLDQISIWDNAKGEEIPTGGKSQRTEFPNYPIEDRIKDLKGENPSDTPGFEHLSKDVYDHLEPDERAFLSGNKTLQRNVMTKYHEIAPSVNETTNAMQAGAALGGWWKRYIDVFHNLGDSGEVVANAIGPSHAEVLKQWHAALSGNKSVQDANNLAWHSYADWLDAGKPTDRKSIDNIIKKNAAQTEESGKKGNAAMSDTRGPRGKLISQGIDTSKLYGLVNSPEMRGERPFTGDVFRDDPKNPLMGSDPRGRGRKIPSMGATVAGKGNLNRLVIDTHIRDFYGRGGTASGAQYIADSAHLRQAAETLGLKGGEGQEQLWGTVLGLKTLLKQGLTPEEAGSKIDSETIKNIGKDYAEVIANDPEITRPGGLLDRLKEKYGIGRGSAGVSEAHRQASSAGETSQGQPGGSENATDKALLGKTAERIRGQISESKIKKPVASKFSALDFIKGIEGLKKPAAGR